jgi:hypothetical protein
MYLIDERIIYGRRLRYRDIHTSLDPIQDLISWVGYLVANNYTQSCLALIHKFSSADAQVIAKEVSYHAKMAQSLLLKSVNSIDETGFLDGYYGILNLMKIYILFSPYHAELSSNKHHGISFKAHDETPANFELDKIKFLDKGAMFLFYKSLCGESIAPNTTMTLKDVIPYLSGVSYEYELSSGRKGDLLYFGISKEEIEGKLYGCLALLNSDNQNIEEIKLVPLLSKTKPHPTKPFFFLGKETNLEDRIEKVAFDCTESLYAYRSTMDGLVTPRRIGSPKMIQELPIALFFFSMSNIIRYYPAYSQELSKSHWGPLLFASRRHALLEFLILFWGHIQKEDYYLNGQ